MNFGTVQIRACSLCVYSRNPTYDAGECWHPRVTQGRGPVPLVEARASGGGCGPEAIHLDYPGLHVDSQGLLKENEACSR